MNSDVDLDWTLLHALNIEIDAVLKFLAYKNGVPSNEVQQDKIYKMHHKQPQ